MKYAIFEVAGGYAKLSEQFNAVTQGHPVDQSRQGIKTARLPDGTMVMLRMTSSGGSATLQVIGPGGQHVKIRAP